MGKQNKLKKFLVFSWPKFMIVVGVFLSYSITKTFVNFNDSSQKLR